MQTLNEQIINLLQLQQRFFASNTTKDTNYRLRQLKRLKAAILRYEDKISEALWEDLHKSAEEAFLTEISLVIQEIDNHIRHLRRWAKPQKVASTLAILPSKCRIISEPLGLALIIAPWNYPFQLVFNPLVGAISAGCCAVVKCSPYIPATAAVMEELITECFPREYVAFMNGNRDVNRALLEQKFDVIFFTGSPELGKIVMRAAAEHLTPVVLELGGKSPCIVDRSADVEIAARRVAWGKCTNAGQTCIAPDYLFLHRDVRDEFVEKYRQAIVQMYGDDPKQSPNYPRIVSDKAFARLTELLQKGRIVVGGETDADEKYIAPTLIEGVVPGTPIMDEEIFGPILPVIPFSNISDVIDTVNLRPKPLALYYFGDKKTARRVLNSTSSGGACINDTLLHIANHRLPFGGVGNSGMGKYHGRDSFLAFSNRRALVVSRNRPDLPFRYSPFKMFGLVKKIL